MHLLERRYLGLYCHRFFRPHPKGRLCYNTISLDRRHNLNENQLLQRKRQLLENASTLFDSTNKQSSDAEKRIAHLEQLVGRLTVALDIQKSLGLVEMTLSEKRSLIAALQQGYSVREICETLGFNRSSFYYHLNYLKENKCKHLTYT